MSQQLTPNFWKSEFEKDGALIPVECLEIFQAHCYFVLERVRMMSQGFWPSEHWYTTSGYRDPTDNRAVHGVSNSQHIATPEYCASDGRPLHLGHSEDLRPLFDRCRNDETLAFDEIILEHVYKQDAAGKWVSAGHDVLHISYVKGTPRRIAKEGESNNLTPYKTWDVVAYTESRGILPALPASTP